MARPTALITGASMGLGREFAEIFAAEGHDLVVVARSKDKLEALAKEIRQRHGAEVTVLAEDLTDPAAPERIVKATQAKKIAVDVLVNNAGFGSTGPFSALDRKRELEMVQVNIAALLDLTHRFLPSMLERRRGRILNVGSTAGFQPGPFMATYYATKAFVNHFTEALASELEGTGVTATVLCPGATATEFAKTARNDTTLLFRLSVADSRKVARDGYRAAMAGRAMTVSGLINKVGVVSTKLSPRFMVRKITRRLNRS